jgi:hypothetical protein
MIEFDYISDETLKASLAADYAEFQTCLNGQAWKAALVLVGSVVETILVDHLLATEYQKRTGTDPLKMQLGALIDACKADKVLSQKTADLSSVLQSYRNLIHPGRLVRLGETANRNSAVIAGEVLQMIVDEIAAKKRAQYGYTADQIVKKLERDESAISIHRHLLTDVPEFELERLLLRVIPKRYFELDTIISGDFGPEPDAEKQSRLATCFRSAFEMSSDEVKKKVTKRFLSVLKEEDHHTVVSYETALFRCKDLEYVSPEEANLVKAHLLSAADKGLSLSLLKTIEGLAPFLVRRDIPRLVDVLVRTSVYDHPNDLKIASRRYLSDLWRDLPSTLDHFVVARLDDWIKHFDRKGYTQFSVLVGEIKTEIEISF